MEYQAIEVPGSQVAHGDVERLRDLLRNRHAGDVAVLLIEHDMKVVMELSERVTVLDQELEAGRVAGVKEGEQRACGRHGEPTIIGRGGDPQVG